MSQATVRIPAPLRPLVGGLSEVTAPGETVEDVLVRLGADHAGFLDRVLGPGGELRAFVNIYIDDRNVRSIDGLRSKVSDGDTIHIVPAVAGGRK